VITLLNENSVDVVKAVTWTRK